MDFDKLSQLGSLLSKDYSKELLRLLVSYRDISASEAASRLGLHIKTAQDFLDGLHSLGILSKTEVHENKRPYFRYSLEQRRLELTIDLNELPGERSHTTLEHLVRELRDSGALFKTSARGDFIAAVTYFTGHGRKKQEKRLNLTKPQGSFLYHLPFPTEPPLAAAEIMRKAGVDESCGPEIIDLLGFLEHLGIIEMEPPS